MRLLSGRGACFFVGAILGLCFLEVMRRLVGRFRAQSAHVMHAVPAAKETSLPAQDITTYTVDLDATLDQCWVPDRHPLDTTIDAHMISGTVLKGAACPGHDFLTLHSNGSVDMSACPPGGNARLAPALKRSPKIPHYPATPWRSMSENHSLGGVKGVHWAFGFCDMPGLNHRHQPFATALEWTPYADRRAYRDCTAYQRDHKQAPNFDILVIVLDSVSRLRFRQLFARTDDLLKTFSKGKKVGVYDFKHTSVYAQNTNGNVRRMFHNCGKDCEGLDNVFSHANSHGFVPSVVDDYCPNHGTCELFPFDSFKVCEELFCNYGNDMTDMGQWSVDGGYSKTCVHGKNFIEHHLDFIEKMWTTNMFNCRKMHVSHSMAGHSVHLTNVVVNDGPLENFLERGMQSFLKNTVVVLTSDHGFHYGHDQKWNNYAAGEHAHRNPILKIIVGPDVSLSDVQKGNLRWNEDRRVTHLDMHKTLLGLQKKPEDGGGQWGSSLMPGWSTDLLNARVSVDRSCRHLKLKEWCPCFKRREQPSECIVDTKDGCIPPELYNMNTSRYKRYPRPWTTEVWPSAKGHAEQQWPGLAF